MDAGKSMALLPKDDRIRIWNALFHQAWSQACDLAKTKGKAPKRGYFAPRLILSKEEQLRLLLLAHCILAIEARANHLIDEMVEEGVWTSGKQRQFSDCRLMRSGSCFQRPFG
jgi:hypothetical protein